MADANPKEDISALKTWYRQAGTPTLTLATAYDADKKTFTVTASQVRAHLLTVRRRAIASPAF